MSSDLMLFSSLSFATTQPKPKVGPTGEPCGRPWRLSEATLFGEVRGRKVRRPLPCIVMEGFGLLSKLLHSPIRDVLHYSNMRLAGVKRG